MSANGPLKPSKLKKKKKRKKEKRKKEKKIHTQTRARTHTRDQRERGRERGGGGERERDPQEYRAAGFLATGSHISLNLSRLSSVWASPEGRAEG